MVLIKLSNLNVTFLISLSLCMSCKVQELKKDDLIKALSSKQETSIHHSLCKTFGQGTGTVTLSHRINGVDVQPDGKIIAVGFNDNYEINATRLNSDGSIDTSFGINGLFTYNSPGYDIAHAVKVLSNGKIIIVGDTNGISYKMAVIQLNNDGTLDNTFGTNGVYTYTETSPASGRRVAIQSDGKILVSGHTSLGAIWRLHSHGAIDSSFATDGVFILPSYGSSVGAGMAIQPDGKILIAVGLNNGFMNQARLVRINSSGALDSTFATGGTLTFISPTSSTSEDVLFDNGKIYLIGSINDGVAIRRLESDGSIDTTFNGSGYIRASSSTHSYGVGAILQSDGKIVVAGTSQSNPSAVAWRFGGTSLDTGFGDGGVLNMNEQYGGYSVALHPNGNKVVGGNSGILWCIAD